jgi:hypothetical protein
MNIDNLIEMLEEKKQELGTGDVEVRLMTQASWPFEYTVRSIVTTKELIQQEVYAEADEDEGTIFEGGDLDAAVQKKYDAAVEKGDVFLYLVEGHQIGYGNKAAWDLPPSC